MQRKGFSYAEAMVTMLIVAIIMVATTPIISKKLTASKRSTIWAWTTDTKSTFFGTGTNQRVVMGSSSANQESARLIIHAAEDERTDKTTIPPLLKFEDVTSNDELGRLIVNKNSLGLGYNALNKMGSAIINNTAIGAGALSQATGANNTALGHNACSSITAGTDNICIGNDITGIEGNKGLYIGTYIKGNENEIKFITSSIKMDGLPSSSYDDLQSTLTYLYNSVTALSDLRLKNVQGLSTAGLNEINKIVVKNFTFKKDKRKIPHVGVIAQELRTVFPNSVTKGDDGYLRINKDEMFYAMINSIKELSAKFAKQDATNQRMENEIENLKQENILLKQKIAEIEQKLSQK